MEQTNPRKLAVLLPGIGYTCDRPLLYYGGKLAASLGWEPLPVTFDGFPKKVRGDRARLEESMHLALLQTEERLKEIPWASYASVAFISKSIGTVAAVAFAQGHHLRCRHVLLTPLEDTFAHPLGEAVAFHGSADPWAATPEIRRLCALSGTALHVTEGANHSLETGDVHRDITTLQETLMKMEVFLRREDRGREE